MLISLQNRASGASVVLGWREWALLRCVDGTRGERGILAAAERLGAKASLADLRQFLEDLRKIAMVRVATTPAAAATRREQAVAPGELELTKPSRHLFVLDGYRFRCDGGGTCCRLYQTIVFAPREVIRARQLAPERLSGDIDGSVLFTPLRLGAGDTPETAGHAWRGATVTLVNGRCAFLEEEGTCCLHRRGGSKAKPTGCNLFPYELVDDGEALWLGPRPACRCVFTSAAASEPTGAKAAPSSEPWPELSGLQPIRLGQSVAVTATQRWPLPRYRAWAKSRVLSPDARQSLVELAASVDALPEGWRDAELRRLRAGLLRHLGESQWRAADDLAWRIPHGLLGACEELLAAPPERAEAPHSSEAFYLVCLRHTHGWARADHPLQENLLRRSLVVELARVLGRRYPDEELASQPVALAEAALHAYGI